MATVLVCAFLLVNILICATGQQPSEVTCGSKEMKITFKQEFFLSLNIDVANPTQIHFKGHRECVAEPEDDGYSLTLKPPFNDCGVTSETRDDVHVFSNEILYSTDNSKILIFRFSCTYKRKYIVSSDLALTPAVRTLSFATERGTFDVSMNLFQRKDFNPKSMYGPKPVILIGVPVYAAVSMVDPFQNDQIVNTIEACYATDDEDHSIQKLTHTLITNRCASSDDQTVRILSNGESMESRFKFNMFRWNSDVEYFYLHCEIKVCNKSREQCVGLGPVCEGVDPSEEEERRKRDVFDEEETGKVVQDDKGIISFGPVAMTEEEEVDYEQGGESQVEDIVIEIEKDQGFLEVYIYIILAVVIVIVGVTAIIIIVLRKKSNKRKALKNGSAASSEVNSIEMTS